MIQRKSVKRVAIKLPMDIKMQWKIQELQQITREDDILEIAEHYNMIARQTLNKSGYNSLSLKNPTQHKNWIHFERVYEICRMKDWDAKLYIEAQFLRSKKWVKCSYPYPSMLYSRNALLYFTNHLSTLKQTYERDTNGGKRKRGKETKSLRQEIVDGIVSSIESLSFYIKCSNHTDAGQTKALKIFQSWEELSPYYLWSVPWFANVLADLQGRKVEEYRDKFKLIQSSSSTQKTIETTVNQVEQYFDIPPNIELG